MAGKKKSEDKEAPAKAPKAAPKVETPAPEPKQEIILATCQGCGTKVAVYGTITTDGRGYCSLACLSSHTNS